LPSTSTSPWRHSTRPHRRVLLNRERSRNAQNRAARRARRGAARRRGRRRGARGHPRGTGPMFSSGTTSARRRCWLRCAPVQISTRRSPSTAAPGWVRRTACSRNALLLHQHVALAQPAQDHHRPGTRTSLRAGLMLMWACDLIVAARTPSSLTWWNEARHVRPRVLRHRGVRTPQDQGADAHRDSLGAEEAYQLGMVSKIFPKPSCPSARSTSRAASLSCPR